MGARMILRSARSLPFCLPVPLRLFWRDVIQALRFSRRWYFRHGRTVLMALVCGVVPALLMLHQFDDRPPLMLRLPAEGQGAIVKEVAKQFSFWGDFLGFNVLIVVAMQVAGWSLRSRRLVRMAVASLVCAVLCGLCANVLRAVTGRPRPSTARAVGSETWRGPTASVQFHAFPSAHAATAFGGALPVMMTAPSIGTPLVLIATGVGWSRIQLNRHHLTDVMTSVFLALVISLPLSHWALRSPAAHRAAPSAPRAALPKRLPRYDLA